MKKRNLVIVAFMLVAAMTIGVGYAALSVTLTLTGYATYSVDDAQDDFESSVYFASGKVITQADDPAEYSNGSGSTADAVGAVVSGAHSVTFDVKSPIYVGEKAVFEFVVNNDSGTKVYLTWDDTEWVGTHYTLEYSDTVLSIEANSTATVRVVATLNAVPTTSHSETFILKAAVSDVAP